MTRYFRTPEVGAHLIFSPTFGSFAANSTTVNTPKRGRNETELIRANFVQRRNAMGDELARSVPVGTFDEN